MEVDNNIIIANSVQNLNNFNIENQTISSFSEKKNYDSLNSFQNTEQLYSALPDDKNYIYPSNPDHLFEQVSNLIKVSSTFYLE